MSGVLPETLPDRVRTVVVPPDEILATAITQKSNSLVFTQQGGSIVGVGS